MKKPISLITLPKPVPCRIIKRLNRFIITVQLEDGREEPALIRNTGRLHETLYPGAAALCIPRGKTGKTRYLLIGGNAEESKEAELIDPATQCRAFETAAARGLIPWLNRWQIERREITIGNSRLDYRLRSATGEQGFLESKSAVHFTGYYTMYSDCPTERGRRHIRLLQSLRQSGYRSILAFMAAHPDAEAFKPDVEADPDLAFSLLQAAAYGVEVYAVKMALRLDGAILLFDPTLPVDLSRRVSLKG
ncbi:MAG: DNA/RNA nuclease SfsA [Thaumarchaeota archaeon]|nr:DNA/RNA nuclease SfsA [Nitrososphaerota archaeon]MCL5317982.1 DNA/RNA nuclease SfsA [Nitrososphaerota archaeon]